MITRSKEVVPSKWWNAYGALFYIYRRSLLIYLAYLIRRLRIISISWDATSIGNEYGKDSP